MELTTSTASVPRVHYTRAPILQAVIDFGVDNGEGTPLEIFDSAKWAGFSDFTDRTPLYQANIEFSSEDQSPTATRTQLGFQYASADKKRVVSARLNGFGLMRLPPYESWEPFCEEARKLWKSYVAVRNPKSVNRVAVRYINRLELPLPKRIFAHGWWTSEGRKMSKTMGNFVGLEKLRDLAGKYGGCDSIRYYLLRAAPFGNDLDWTDADFNKSFNELANVVGNCLNRTIKMIGRYREGVLPAMGERESIDDSLIARTEEFGRSLAQAYENLELQQCALLPVELARATNGYIDATAPFTLAKDPAKASRLNTVLNLSAQAMTRVLAGLLPLMPEKAAEGLRQLNVTVEGKTLGDLFRPLVDGHRLGEGQPLFPKIDPPGEKGK